MLDFAITEQLGGQMRGVFFTLILAAIAPAAFAQPPQIFGRGTLNAASFMQAGLPARSTARGSLFSLFGRNLRPASSPTPAFPLTTTLGGVSIPVVQRSTGRQAMA